MQDGYYLSTYLTPPGPARLVGAWVRHDANISLWRKDGDRVDLLAHWELERLTGVKHEGTATLSAADSWDLIGDLIADFGLTPADLNCVWGTPGLADPATAAGQRLDPDLPRHAVAHLFTGLFLDSRNFYRDSIVALAVDGGPDKVLERAEPRHLFAGAAVVHGTMSLFPVESPGPLYDHAKYRFGMQEGSLMALASASTATCEFDLEPALAGYYGDEGVHHLAGRTVADVAAAADATLADEDARFTHRENHISAVMKVVQELSYRIAERNVAGILDRFSIPPAEAWLCMTGGYALNCPTNSALVERFGFRGLSSPPYVNDSGQSIGIALEQFYAVLQPAQLVHRFPGPYLGRRDRGLDRTLEDFGDYVAGVDDFHARVAAADVAGPEPVVWFDGAAESGPRALGHRSILADPRRPAAKVRLNEIKQREWWRPVAPVVLREHLADWFENARPSPYMLETFRFRPGCAERVPAVVHLDGSARIQSVAAAENPLLAGLLAEFHADTGVPMLCNTSLNDKAEAIIDSAAQAVNFCLRKGIAVGYFNGTRIAFRNHADYQEREPAQRHAPWLEATGDELKAAEPVLNPAGLPDVYLFLYLYSPELCQNYDPSDPRSAERLRRVLDLILSRNPALRAAAAATMEQERKLDGQRVTFESLAIDGMRL